MWRLPKPREADEDKVGLYGIMLRTQQAQGAQNRVAGGALVAAESTDGEQRDRPLPLHTIMLLL